MSVECGYLIELRIVWGHVLWLWRCIGVLNLPAASVDRGRSSLVTPVLVTTWSSEPMTITRGCSLGHLSSAPCSWWSRCGGQCWEWTNDFGVTTAAATRPSMTVKTYWGIRRRNMAANRFRLDGGRHIFIWIQALNTIVVNCVLSFRFHVIWGDAGLASSIHCIPSITVET